jgi:hypothetical protein
LPKEHGVWAYLLGPQVAAIAAAPRPAAAALFALAALVGFFAYGAVMGAARTRQHRPALSGLAPAAVAAALGALAVWETPPSALAAAPAGLVALGGAVLLDARGRRSAGFQLLGIAGFSVLGAGALLAAGGSPQAAATLAVAQSATFAMTLLVVRDRLARELANRSPVIPSRWLPAALLACLLASAAAGAALGFSAAGAAPALYLARMAVPDPRDRRGRVNLPKVGAVEAAFALIIALVLGVALRFAHHHF